LPSNSPIEQSADEERERQMRLITLTERQRTAQYHAFLCHNHRDKPVVRQLEKTLLEQGRATRREGNP
jgi:hypothetical protein